MLTLLAFAVILASGGILVYRASSDAATATGICSSNQNPTICWRINNNQIDGWPRDIIGDTAQQWTANYEGGVSSTWPFTNASLSSAYSGDGVYEFVNPASGKCAGTGGGNYSQMLAVSCSPGTGYLFVWKSNGDIVNVLNSDHYAASACVTDTGNYTDETAVTNCNATWQQVIGSTPTPTPSTASSGGSGGGSSSGGSGGDTSSTNQGICSTNQNPTVCWRVNNSQVDGWPRDISGDTGQQWDAKYQGGVSSTWPFTNASLSSAYSGDGVYEFVNPASGKCAGTGGGNYSQMLAVSCSPGTGYLFVWKSNGDIVNVLNSDHYAASACVTDTGNYTDETAVTNCNATWQQVAPGSTSTPSQPTSTPTPSVTPSDTPTPTPTSSAIPLPIQTFSPSPTPSVSGQPVANLPGTSPTPTPSMSPVGSAVQTITHPFISFWQAILSFFSGHHHKNGSAQ